MNRLSHLPLPIDLVVNWHVTEACNFRCGYCYAHWATPDKQEVIRDSSQASRLVHRLAEELGPGRILDVGSQPLQVRTLRLNFAGGEPLLFLNQVLSAMKCAKQLGLDVSIITNGSRITRVLLDEMVPLLSILGISFDADGDDMNERIGRLDARSRKVSIPDMKECLEHARMLKPDLVVKINTVVNAFNWSHDLHALIQAMRPDQWKIFQMLPSIHRNLEVSEQEFQSFIRRHKSLTSLMRVEGNASMEGSYLMVDPHGRFYQNGTGEFGYAYSKPILEVGLSAALAGINWSAEKFLARYQLLRQMHEVAADLPPPAVPT